MTDTALSPDADNSRARKIALWILRGLMAALFLFAAIMKLSSQPMMIAEFDVVGLGQWFRYFTGALELAGAIAIVLPRWSVWGALLLLAVSAGAFVAQITVIHGDWIHTIVVAAILITIVYLQRGSLGSARL